MEVELLPHAEADVSNDGGMINVFELRSIAVPFFKGYAEGCSAGGGVDNMPEAYDGIRASDSIVVRHGKFNAVVPAAKCVASGGGLCWNGSGE